MSDLGCDRGFVVRVNKKINRNEPYIEKFVKIVNKNIPAIDKLLII